jgi:hypothetical protein
LDYSHTHFSPKSYSKDPLPQFDKIRKNLIFKNKYLSNGREYLNSEKRANLE